MDLAGNFGNFAEDLREWRGVAFWYLCRKGKIWGGRFENSKSAVVALLIHKRGRHSRSFLNLSVFVLASAGLIFAPLFADSAKSQASDFAASEGAPAVTTLNQEVLGASTEKSVRPRDQAVVYKTESGDTLSKIAEKFGVSADTIRWANKLKNDSLSVGQELSVPPVTGIMHTVSSGETIYSIAKKYRTEPQKIADFPFNDFVNLDNFSLSAGQILVVPDGIMPDLPSPTRYLAQTPDTLPPLTGAGDYIWPARGSISQSPVWYHMALDIANASSPPVQAARAGTVVFAQCLKWGYGCHVILDHGDGMQTLYGHLSKISVSEGAGVGRGGVLGTMGSTGRSTGTHLHFEVRRNGAPVDPRPFLK